MKKNNTLCVCVYKLITGDQSIIQEGQDWSDSICGNYHFLMTMMTMDLMWMTMMMMMMRPKKTKRPTDHSLGR